MPLYMDVHRKAPAGAKAKDVADAHMADVKTQGKYGVQYLRYWFDEKNGKIFCLVDAPNPEAANRVHKEAHGLVADETYPVTEGMSMFAKSTKTLIGVAAIAIVLLATPSPATAGRAARSTPRAATA